MDRRYKNRRPPDLEAQEHHRQLLQYGRRLGNTREDVEDAAQEAWLAALARGFDRIDNAIGWMRTAMVRALQRSRERDDRRLTRERLAARLESAPSTLALLADRSEVELLTEAIDELPSLYAEVLRLRYIRGLEPAEIAATLERPVNTVRTHLKRGLDLLRLRFQPRRGLYGLAWLPLLRRLPGGTPRSGLGSPRALRHAALLAVVTAGVGVGLSLHRASAPGSSADLRLDAASHAATGGSRHGPLAAVAGTRSALDRERAHPGSSSAGFVELVALRRDGRVDRRVAGVPAFGVPEENGAPTVPLGTTDENGALRVEAGELPLWVWFESDEAVSRRCLVPASLAGDAVVLPVVRTSPVELRATVGGLPVRGAKIAPVCALDEPTSDGGLLYRPPRPRGAETNEDGVAVLQRVPGSMPTWFEIRSAGHAPTAVAVPRGRSVVAVELAAPCGLSLALRRPDGRPASGAKVRLDFAFPGETRLATADEHGEVSWEGLPRGRFLLRAQLGGASRVLAGDLRAVESLGELWMDETNTIAGRLADFPAGMACTVVLVPGALTARDTEHPFPDLLDAEERFATVDAAGRFFFAPCMRQKYDVVVRLPDSNVTVAAARDVRPGAAPLSLRYEPPAETSVALGRVEGTELAAGRTWLRPLDDDAPPLLAVQTDGSRFESAPVRPGHYELLVGEPRHPGRVVRFELDPGKNDLGRLHTATGEVHVLTPDASELGLHLVGPAWTASPVQGLSASRWILDEQGAHLPSVPAGEYSLLVRREGHADERRSIVVRAGARSDVELAPRPGRHVLLLVESERRLLPEEVVALTLLRADGSPCGEFPDLDEQLVRQRPDVVLAWRTWLPAEGAELRLESSGGLGARAELPGVQPPDTKVPLRLRMRLRADAARD